MKVFSEIVDHITCPPCLSYNFSKRSLKEKDTKNHKCVDKKIFFFNSFSTPLYAMLAFTTLLNSIKVSKNNS